LFERTNAMNHYTDFFECEYDENGCNIGEAMKEQVFNQAMLEFNINYKICVIENKKRIEFIGYNYPRFVEWHALWGCNPPFSNIKYLIENMFGLIFIGSETDELCKTIHETFVNIRR